WCTRVGSASSGTSAARRSGGLTGGAFRRFRRSWDAPERLTASWRCPLRPEPRRLRAVPASELAREREPGGGAELVERLHDVGVELRAGVAADLLRRVVDRPLLLVRALVHEHVEDVGDGDQAALDRDVARR